MKQLDRLLFEQGGDCFFCKRPLAKADASIEHLLAQANGGTSAEENVVACCKAINCLLGNKPLKEKFAIILRQRHGFQCPAKQSAASGATPPPAANVLRLFGSLSLLIARFRLQCFKKRTPNPALQETLRDNAA